MADHRKTKKQRVSMKLHSLLAATTILAVTIPLGANAAPQAWLLNAIAPVTTLVSVQEDLDWRLMSTQTVKKDDCVRVVFENPYEIDAPETYKSFSMVKPYKQLCDFSTSHVGTCSVIDSQTFEMKFTKDNPNKKITGRTNRKPFLNPYSSRQFSYVTASLYRGCDVENEPLVTGTTTIAAFQQAVILEDDIQFLSSSEKLAVTGAVLTANFKPSTQLPKNGMMSLQVPAWYTISEVNLPNELSSDSMLGFDSEATIDSHLGEGFNVLRTTFDASSRSLTFQYTGTRVIPKNEEVRFSVTSFKNPVNKDRKKGFRLTTLDAQGYLVDQSEANLALDTPMTIHGELVGKELLMLGDAEGQNIGRVFEYNKLYFFLSSYIPFEQFCYFKFVFPKKLKLDVNMQLIEGEGIFAPTAAGKGLLPADAYHVDLEENIVYIEGCRQPYSLSSRPYGIVQFQYVLLPDYVTDTDPVELYAYSDDAYLDLVFEESKASGGGMGVSREMLQPGKLDLVEFAPSDYYAYVKDVKYTISIAPAHDMYPSTRIIITMPENLKFDPRKGCTVTYTAADCELDAQKNILTLTNVFKERTPGGTILKFEISTADNPIGARDAGKWGARTEGWFSGQYYIVDGAEGGDSFYALPGYLKSTLEYKAEQTFSLDSELDFTFETEHNVPKDGFLRVTLPVEMAFPDEMVQEQKPKLTIGQLVTNGPPSSVEDSMEFVELTSEYILLKFTEGHDTANNPIRLTLQGIRTPRSFRPSSEFRIETMSVEKYVIDGGGTDIAVIMSQMNTLTGLEITPLQLINGEITEYKIKIDTFVYLKDRDRIVITTPPTVTFGPDTLSCRPASPAPIGVTECSAERTDATTFAVILQKVNQDAGVFEVIVNGIKNPPNFRKSGLFSNIYMQTFDYYNIQLLEEYENLWVQTNEVATITDYTRQQSTEVFGQDSVYIIEFTPKNPISKDGIMTLEWSDQVIFNEGNSVGCKVQTYQSFNSECVIDFENKIIKIYNIFIESDQYISPIQIQLEKITNPVDNRNLLPFVIRTYDDQAEQFPIDKLEYVPLTQCNFPCKRCSSDKDYCYSCWKDLDENFLMTADVTSTCKTSCDDGWTTDGNQDLICTACDSTCKTCRDKGDVGDKDTCIECADGYNFRLGAECVAQCPIGTYQSGNRCLECDSKCMACDGAADFCTACSPNSSLNFLFGNNCLDTCPPGMGSNAGVCFDCEFPCSECSTGPKICLSCSQAEGLAFLYGPNCIDQCPVGFIINEELKKCEGCGSGCDRCDENDQRICLECESTMMLYEGTCVSDCPKGYLSNYSASLCYPLSDLDIDLIPFPCLIIAMVFFFLSYVGSKQKRKHLFIPNWLVLMGLLEHGALLSQIILTFRYGTFRYSIFIILAWVFFLAANIVFAVLHHKRIAKKDRLYSNWRNRPANIWARRLMNVTGIIGNWKGYKLSYSGFWGVKLTPARFTTPKVYRDLQRRFMWINILSVYAVVVVLNCYGLYDLDWGTQLYIQMIENILIFLMVIWASIWEQKRQENDYLADSKYSPLGKGKLNVMGELDEQDLADFSKTKEHLLGQADLDSVFVERKFEELTKMFGDRKCKSFYDLNRNCEEDPREVFTWPCSPSQEIRGPIEPLPDPQPDNCYFMSLNQDQMFQMKFISKGVPPSKAIQSDNFDADQTLRRDAYLVGHQEQLAEPTHYNKKKQVRGRKNRFFKQIDNEDNETGLLLDDDGATTRRPVDSERNELLDPRPSPKRTQKHKKREAAQKKLQQQQTLEKAMQLTEENMKLKQVLDEQREIDRQHQVDFQTRIMEEERRRQEILENIEKTRAQRQKHKSQVQNNIQQEKEFCLAEIEKQKQEQLEKNADLPESERAALQEKFEIQQARLESEFNEKILKTQREADPSTASPVRYGSRDQLQGEETQQIAGRLVPQGVATGSVGAASRLTSHASQAAASASASGDQRSVVATPPEHAQRAAATGKSSVAGIPSQHRSSVPSQKSIQHPPGTASPQKSQAQTGVLSQISQPGQPSQISQIGELYEEAQDKSGDPFDKSIRLVPQGVATDVPPVSDTSFREETSQLLADVDAVSGKKSQTGTSAIDGVSSINQPGATHRMSMLQTATEASIDDSVMEPVEADRSEFNEIDIVGTLDRDDRGNIIVPTDENGNKRAFDQEGRPINHYGYLINKETGDIFHNTSLAKVFARRELDERGNIPMPFALEKYNFNPFDLLGTFFYEDPEDPLSFNKGQRGNRFIDELGRFVTMQGFMVNEEGSIVDKNGVKRFDHMQFKQFGGFMPKMFNYYGKTFEIQEIMGVFDRDSSGQIQFLLGKDEQSNDVYVDKAGFMVNKKGYIVTRDGHVCTREGKVLFLKKQLRKGGEIPKIFPFTRFNINRIMSDFEMDPGGHPILSKNDRGQTVDKQGRLCNEKGYLVDRKGNVVDLRGKLVFEKRLLELTGEIPEIFHSNILRTDSASSLSRFMSDIDRDQRFDASGITAGAEPHYRHAAASDTSFESMMEDSPSRYDQQNQRFNQSLQEQLMNGAGAKSARWAGTQLPDNIMEEMSEYEAGEVPHKRKRKKVKNKGQAYVVEQVTGRDVAMASAYGGVAKPRVRKMGPKFSTGPVNRAGLQTSQGGARPPNPRMQNLTDQVKALEQQDISNASNALKGKKIDGAATNRGEAVTQRTGPTPMDLRVQNATTGWRDQTQQEEPSLADESEQDNDLATMVRNLRNKRDVAVKKRQKGAKEGKSKASPRDPTKMPLDPDAAYEEDYEKMYRKDIDKFIDGSDFEVESLAGFSEISKGTFKSVTKDHSKMKGLEKVYLQRLEFQQLGDKAKKPYRAKPPKHRQFMDRFCDDPKYIAKGEMLKFEIGNPTTHTGSSGKKPQVSPRQVSPPPQYLDINQQRSAQRSQTSMNGQEGGVSVTTGPFLRPAQTPQNLNIAQQDSANSGRIQNSPRQQPSTLRQNLR